MPTVLHNLYALATNAEVQQKAYEELSAVVGSADVLTATHLSQLNFIKAVVKETFRYVIVVRLSSLGVTLFIR